MRRSFVIFVVILLILSCAITAYAVSAEGEASQKSSTIQLHLQSSGAEYQAEEEAVEAYIQNGLE